MRTIWGRTSASFTRSALRRFLVSASRSDIAGLNLAQYPSILVELGNMKNPVDSGLMKTPEGRQKYADAVVRAEASFEGTHGSGTQRGRVDASLIDTVRAGGVEALAQVDLGVRAHRHQALRDLGGMATQIIAAALARVGGGSAVQAHEAILKQYLRGLEPVEHVVPIIERGPAKEWL